MKPCEMGLGINISSSLSENSGRLMPSHLILKYPIQSKWTSIRTPMRVLMVLPYGPLIQLHLSMPANHASHLYLSQLLDTLLAQTGSIIMAFIIIATCQ
ncbi:hypothetical protein N7467_000929 [Penicillium canescens]|nr:hypothetical protein N7467_000929 [Penicillium canescens]